MELESLCCLLIRIAEQNWFSAFGSDRSSQRRSFFGSTEDGYEAVAWLSKGEGKRALEGVRQPFGR